MSAYVLVHGAWYGAWCWNKVVSFLEQAGHKAIAPDLPGQGLDRTPIAQVTMDAYCKKVAGIVEAQAEPVVLVGHSMGGRVVTQVAELCADKVKRLVYVAAVLLPNGESSMPVDPDAPVTLLEQSITDSVDGSHRVLRKDALRELFYHDCPVEDQERAEEYFLPRQASQPFTVPMRTTDENYGRIPRVYIECLSDRAMTLNEQRLMHAAMPCEKVISMETGHSPFLAAPEELARHLISLG